MKKYIIKLKWILIIQIIFSALYTLTLAFRPYLNKILFDYDFSEDYSKLYLLGLAYLSCIFLSAIFQYISQVFEWKTDFTFSKEIKKDVFLKLMFRERKEAQLSNGEIISVINNDISTIEQNYIEAIIDIIKSINMLVIYGYFLIVFVDSRIALSIFCVTIFSIFVPKITSKRLSSKKKEQLESLGKLTDKMNDILNGKNHVNIHTVDNLHTEYNKYLIDSERKKYKFGKFNTFSNILNGFVMDALSFTTFLVIGYLFINGDISIGTGVASLGYVESFIYPIKYILNDINYIHSTKEVKDKLLVILNKEIKKEILKQDFNEKISLRNIGVKFDDFEIQNINYDFIKGKKYAIVGHSGSGKSSLLNAISKNIRISEGEIFYDGSSINDLDVSGLVYYISQSDYIYMDNFIQNASIYGSYHGNSPEELFDLLNLTFNKEVKYTNNCRMLSGGEMQAIGFIRMLMSDRQILLLDEPFSAVDYQNMKRLMDIIMGLNNKTILFVTHNLDEKYLSKFDRVINLNNGKLEDYVIPALD